MVQLFKSAKPKKTNNKPYQVKIESLDNQARGVARHKGKVVFVEGALPNETVLVQNIADKKQFTEAKLHKIIQASNDRVQAECKWYAQCGGCQLQHLNTNAQIDEKQKFVAGLLGKVGLYALNWQPALQGQATYYRNRSRLATWYEGKQDYLHVGFRQRKSKKIVEIDSCLIMPQAFQGVLSELPQALNKLQGKKHLGHIEFNHVGEKPIMLIKTNEQLSIHDQQILTNFAASNKVNLYILDAADELTDLSVHQLKSSELYYPLEALKIHYNLTDFVQVNHQMNQAMVQQAIDWLAASKEDTILDMFCGSGNFALPLAKMAQYVLGIEGSDEAVQQAKRNAQLNNLTNAEFQQMDLAKTDSLQQIDWLKYNKMILDPSREGAFGICLSSANWHASKVLYVACDANSLMRDSAELVSHGYHIEKIGLIDMFPHTAHVETMALFSK
ncbi:23S rRNA (uracil(1939)-C(5))-methyltransferase RlmD [Catenovulum sediminis]|uniref:23S rRNA (uracil(1939)-C(5))-methyltransferase RlmD n=1 Tax=Catenovulum sediminis TaxID=1740262 RepID=UPI00117F191D|nr:23S rRNA (uracil(1939)-C(5))-methyltransferase RlmD [Catenovulum sediminis]